MLALLQGARAVIMREVDGQLMEPYEELSVDVDEQFQGVVIEKLGKNKKGVFPVELPTYYLVTIPWGRGVIDQEKSEFVYKGQENEVYCPLGRHNGYVLSYQRYVMKEGTWQGDDFFTPVSSQIINCGSERLKQVVEKYQITGLNLVPSEKFTYNFHDFPSFSIKE